MTYFIKGPYTTVTELRDAITQLQKEGYPDSSLTIVADKKDHLLQIQKETHVAVRQDDLADLTEEKDLPLWERFAHTFTGFFTNQDTIDRESQMEMDEDREESPDELLLPYRRDLEDGKILILVEDLLNRDAKLNLDRQPDDVQYNVPPSDAMIDATFETESHPDVTHKEDVLDEETTYTPPSEGDRH